MIRFPRMREIDIGADELVETLLSQPDAPPVCLLDSCGVGKPGSNRLIAGIGPVKTIALWADDPNKTLDEFVDLLGDENLAAIFSISYDFGLKLNGLQELYKKTPEPDVYAAFFDCLIIHDYDETRTFVAGNAGGFDRIEGLIKKYRTSTPEKRKPAIFQSTSKSNFSRQEYVAAVEKIKELIRAGDTYQTNLTQQLRVDLAEGVTPESVFRHLRHNHPSPFAAYIEREDSTIVSASPEQFIAVEHSKGDRLIKASPIKGTRPRGTIKSEDDRLRAELLNSEKDRAENTMIVDLMRNDLGRVCEFGSVAVDELCRIEEHPTLFHLVSTVSGTLSKEVGFSDIIRAVFPCGSITGAPKIRTMEIIGHIENQPRGLSMGAIGCRAPESGFEIGEMFEISVAIRTMVIRDRTALFNVGGGIVIDSDPENEHDESMLKAKALLSAMNAFVSFEPTPEEQVVEI